MDGRDVSALVGGGLAFLAEPRATRSSPSSPPQLVRAWSTSSAAWRRCGSAASARTWPLRARRRPTASWTTRRARAPARSRLARQPVPVRGWRLSGDAVATRRRRRRLRKALSSTHRCRFERRRRRSPRRGGDLEGAEKAYADALLRAERSGGRQARRPSRASSWPACRPSIARSTPRRRSPGDLAALIGVQLAPSCRPPPARGHRHHRHAQPLGVPGSQPSPARASSIPDNHTFSRARLCAARTRALAMSRLLSRVAAANPAAARGSPAPALRSLGSPPWRRWPSRPA